MTPMWRLLGSRWGRLWGGVIDPTSQDPKNPISVASWKGNGTPAISGESRLVKYCNSARLMLEKKGLEITSKTYRILQETNIAPLKVAGKMIFLFTLIGLILLVPRRVVFLVKFSGLARPGSEKEIGPIAWHSTLVFERILLLERQSSWWSWLNHGRSLDLPPGHWIFLQVIGSSPGHWIFPTHMYV